MAVDKRRKKKVEILQKYFNVFNSPDGEEVLKDMANTFHFTDTTHVEGDALESAYREGQRSVIMRILQTVKSDPTKLLRLYQGNTEEN